jgi:hypothetical protein
LYAAKHAGRNRVEVADTRYGGTTPDRPRKRTWEKPTAPANMVHGVWQQRAKKPSDH